MRIERSGGMEEEKGPSNATRQHLPLRTNRETVRNEAFLMDKKQQEQE